MSWAQAGAGFTEDHAITQSNTRGTTLIHLTRYFSDWFTSGARPTISKDRIFTFYHRQLIGATLTNSTAVAAAPSLSESQMVDYLDVVTMLTAPGQATLTDGGLNMQLNAPAGLHEWLVYAPSARSNYNYPLPASSLTVNVVGRPAIRPTHANREPHRPIAIAIAAQWQDLTMVGVESADTNPAVPY